MLHSELITEYPCDGELVRVEERCTRGLELCRGCGTEFTYEPDSTWVFIVSPGMRSDVLRETRLFDHCIDVMRQIFGGLRRARN